MQEQRSPRRTRSSTRAPVPRTRLSSPTIPHSHASQTFLTQPSRHKPSSFPDTSASVPESDPCTGKLQMPRYRPVAPIPDHIREHCAIYLDEQLYTSAITLLSDLVTNGQARPDRLTVPVYAPPPLHIETVACLLIHPRYTNQAPPDERTQVTAQAITFLRDTLAIIGPVNAGFKEAFSLIYEDTRASRRAYNDNYRDNDDSDSDSGTERLKGLLANNGRLRRCAKDFWHIVGWAFNCSVRYPKRWKYWKVWLAFMIDVLDADWKERDRLDKEDAENPSRQIKQEMNPGNIPENRLSDCLLLQYLSHVQGRSSPLARVVRSVFAGGTQKSFEEFPEVFSGETKEVKHTGQKRKRGRFGDYNDEDDELEETTDATDQTPEPGDDADMNPDPYLGGSEAMDLRQKLVMLLSRAAYVRHDVFVSTYDLYEAVYICTKDLPVPAFATYSAPPFSSYIPAEAYVSISMLYLLRLLPNKAPQPHQVQDKPADEISEIVLRKCYLPFPANTSSVADNARVSIQVENMLRLFLKACDWEYTPAFGTAIEQGISAREKKVKMRGGRDATRKDSAEQEDLKWLRASGKRLRLLAKFMAMKKRSADLP